MGCTQTLTGIAYDCAPSMAGVKRVLLINAAEISAITVTDSKVSAVTKVEGKAFKEYRFRPQTAYANAERTISAENGTSFVAETVFMQFSKQDTAKRLEMEAIARTESVAVVEDCNGLYWMYGRENALTATANQAATGTAAGDFNGYNVTLGANESELPMEVSATIVPGLLVAEEQ